MTTTSRSIWRTVLSLTCGAAIFTGCDAPRPTSPGLRDIATPLLSDDAQNCSSVSNNKCAHAGIWVVGGSNAPGGNVANAAVEFTTAQLQFSNNGPPAVILQFPVTLGFNIDATAPAVDVDGNLWIANDNSNTVVGLTPAQLGTSGSPTPAVILSGAALSGAPYALAFDSDRDLWVANINSGTIVKFTRAQLRTTGTPTPVVTLTDTTQGFTAGPSGLAFDREGNLWVANNVANTLVKYPASHLRTDGQPTVTITGASFNFPEEIAFDESGNLWVANTAAGNVQGTIVEFAADAIRVSGSPNPVRTLIPPGSNIGTVPTGVAFDDDGNLWFTEILSRGLGEYTKAQLEAGGNPPPAIEIGILETPVDSLAPVGLALYPRSKRLPH
jgi:streptogramin lyase